MKFWDADVKKPLGAVSAMVDEGNTVVFSRKWGCYVENDITKEKIPMVRKGGNYVMVLDAVDEKGKKIVQSSGKERAENAEMDVGGMGDDEDEEMVADEEKVVFRRRVL